MESMVSLSTKDAEDKEMKTARKSALNLITVISSLPSEDPNQKLASGAKKKKKGKRGGGKKKKPQKRLTNCQVILRLCETMMKQCTQLGTRNDRHKTERKKYEAKRWEKKAEKQKM